MGGVLIWYFPGSFQVKLDLRLISRMKEDNQDTNAFTPFLELPRTNRWLRGVAAARENPVGFALRQPRWERHGPGVPPRCPEAALSVSGAGSAGMRRGCSTICWQQGKQPAPAEGWESSAVQRGEMQRSAIQRHSGQRNLTPCESLQFTARRARRCDAFHRDTLQWNAVQCKLNAL